ncbi:ADP-ribosylation factor-like protein 2 [Echinococcus granulosus]|uniref:ADP-ribosylation factor-like protein 2 n=1 Tax=Echinococcus granulosus TaxID=6210 RepID=W6V317_ECHGR|nr:ADP-ribosylation factor-like protein 2 [Echinococcus granulosus]EUB60404.1 ADP-ribosylation factor-like protein 2 [Echinococcus granulosus]
MVARHAGSTFFVFVTVNMDYTPDISCDSQTHIANFWEMAKQEAEGLKPEQNSFKTQDLPLARIKKIMKLDDDVKTMMISAEAPILFAKAAELFIRELTLRAWLHTDRNRRRTLQRNDISMAVSYGDTDQFDFLIDIVPRDEGRGHRRSQQQHTQSALQHMAGSSLVQQTQVQVVQQQQATGDDVSIKTETAGPAAATLVAGADGTLTTVTAGQPTVQFATVPAAAATTSGQQIQYVIQLPATSSASNGQPFQIQMLPQQFQTASTDAVATAQVGGTLIATGGVAGTAATTGGLQLVHVVNPQTSVQHSTPSTTTAAGAPAGASTDAANKLQTVHVQTQTLLVQPSGAVVVASSAGPTDETAAASAQPSTTLVSVDGGETYTTAQVFTTASTGDVQTTTSSEERILQSTTTTALEHVEAPQNGLDNAGKTTIVKKFNGEDISTIAPTLGFSIHTLEYMGYRLNAWDVGGQHSLRSYWRNYFETTDALIWVVDSSDRLRLDDCREELNKLLVEERLVGATLLVLANKQDLQGALKPAEIAEALNLRDITTHHWSIYGCSAVTGENLLNSVAWLIKDVSSRIFSAE